MKKYILLLPGLFFLFCSCNHQTIPRISNRSADPPAPVRNKKQVKADALAGKTIFMNRCGKCHVLPDPGQFTKQRWDGILPVMILKAKLDDAEATALKIYISTVAGQ